MKPQRRILLLVLLSLIAVVSSGLFDVRSASADDPDLTVMTQNLYIGSDLAEIFSATNLVQLLQGVETDFNQVVATKFSERARAIAREVARNRPDIIALQEVTLLRTGAAAVPPPNPPTASTVLYDYLEILLSALRSQGQHYTTVVVRDGIDVELPKGYPPTADLRTTDREAILVRSEHHGLRISNPSSGTFANQASIATAGGPLAFKRGWTAVDINIRGQSMRLINTHLETQAFPTVQIAQAGEMLAGPANTTLPVILIGDFNSDANGTTTPTYGNLVTAGFRDAWTQVFPSRPHYPARPGLTCCQAADLLNPVSQLYERVDLVLTRGQLRATGADVVGDRFWDRTPGGLWPSDHAGVVVELDTRLGHRP